MPTSMIETLYDAFPSSALVTLMFLANSAYLWLGNFFRSVSLNKQFSKMLPSSKQMVMIVLFFAFFLIAMPSNQRSSGFIPGGTEARGGGVVHGGGCRCRGHDPQRSPVPSMDYEGHCDYHLGPSFTGDSNRPWCRTVGNCAGGERHHHHHHAGGSSWAYCDRRGVERRRFPDGKLYTSKEVQDYYGGGRTAGRQDAAQKWEDAAPYIEKRMGRDQIAYTVHEFRDHYDDYLDEQQEGRWLEKWQAAGPELRMAPDGKWYSFEEFVDFYGLKEAWKTWDGSAKTKAAEPAGRHPGSHSAEETRRCGSSCAYCDRCGVERRRFPDGKLYTSEEVQDYYDRGRPAGRQDAAQRWEDAAPYIEKRMARDQIAYTVHEFRDYYDDHLDGQGCLEKWQAAGPELRMAPDGKWYSFEEFVDFYGLKEAWKKWDDDRTARKAVPGRAFSRSAETRPLTMKEKVELDMQLMKTRTERDIARAGRGTAEMLGEYRRVNEFSRKVEVLNRKIDQLEMQKARGRTEL